MFELLWMNSAFISNIEGISSLSEHGEIFFTFIYSIKMNCYCNISLFYQIERSTKECAVDWNAVVFSIMGNFWEM